MALSEYEVNYNFEYTNVKGEKVKAGNRFYRQFSQDEHEVLEQCNKQFKIDEPTAEHVRINVKKLKTIE